MPTPRVRAKIKRLRATIKQLRVRESELKAELEAQVQTSIAFREQRDAAFERIGLGCDDRGPLVRRDAKGKLSLTFT